MALNSSFDINFITKMWILYEHNAKPHKTQINFKPTTEIILNQNNTLNSMTKGNFQPSGKQLKVYFNYLF